MFPWLFCVIKSHGRQDFNEQIKVSRWRECITIEHKIPAWFQRKLPKDIFISISLSLFLTFPSFQIYQFFIQNNFVIFFNSSSKKNPINTLKHLYNNNTYNSKSSTRDILIQSIELWMCVLFFFFVQSFRPSRHHMCTINTISIMQNQQSHSFLLIYCLLNAKIANSS